MSAPEPTKKVLVLRSLAMAATLTILKVLIGWHSDSMAILATAADSLLDFVVSLANFLLINKAEKPADENHPYGHGKIESLAGLFQSMLTGAATLAVAGGAVYRFMHPEPIKQTGAGIAVMIIAILLNLWHVRNLRRSMMSTGSQVMASEYVHYASDFLTHLGVIVSLFLFKFTGLLFWDPLMSVFIVLYLVKSVAEIFNNSVSELLDEQLPDSILKEIAHIILHSSPKIVDFHELRTRKVGGKKFIEFHLELRDVDRFHEAHDITEALIAKLRSKFPDSLITVHADPEGGI